MILGGVEIPHDRGLTGHSDADVLTHAVIDAVLGSLGLGDIGEHFPDTDPAYRDANSLSMLESVMEEVRARGWRVQNVDASIAAEAPKLRPYIPDMREGLAAVLGLPGERVSVKATTTEGLGFIGRKEGISCYAVATVVKEGP